MTEKERIIELIENLLDEHEKNGYCTNFNEAETDFECYDSGRYESLKNLLDDIRNI